MNPSFYRILGIGLLLVVLLMGAMFLLPILGAIVIGLLALYGLLWLSGKVFSFFQGGKNYSDCDSTVRSSGGSDKPTRRISKWNTHTVEDAEIIKETKSQE